MATSIALGMRLSTATELANAAGIEGEISVVESEWRAVVHDGTTKGGHPVAKKSEVDALQNTVNQIPNTYLTKTDAQNTYLGKTAKAASATTADSATTAGSATKATQDANGNVINTTYATVASVNTVAEAAGTAQTAANNAQTTANTANTAANNRILKSGSRGSLSGYNTPASSSAAVTISNTSNDDTIVTAAVKVTVNNGSSNQTWTKTVALQNASATVTLGSSWKWVGGSAPTIKANSILVIKWCGTFGLANLVTGG